MTQPSNITSTVDRAHRMVSALRKALDARLEDIGGCKSISICASVFGGGETATLSVYAGGLFFPFVFDPEDEERAIEDLANTMSATILNHPHVAPAPTPAQAPLDRAWSAWADPDTRACFEVECQINATFSQDHPCVSWSIIIAMVRHRARAEVRTLLEELLEELPEETLAEALVLVDTITTDGCYSHVQNRAGEDVQVGDEKMPPSCTHGMREIASRAAAQIAKDFAPDIERVRAGYRGEARSLVDQLSAVWAWAEEDPERAAELRERLGLGDCD